MDQLSFHSNKKHYTAKRINDFYFQLFESDLPSSSYIISDGTYLFMTRNQKKQFCPHCFNGRYFCFLNGTILGTPQTIETLDQKKWEQFFDETFFSFIEQACATLSSEHWSLFEMSSQKKLFDFDLISYENCKNCFPLKQQEWSPELEKEGETVVKKFQERTKHVSSPDDQTSFLSFLEHSFGFIAYEHSFQGSGLEPDPLDGVYLTTVFYSLSSSSLNKPPALSLCGAQAPTQFLSQLKAAMELCERSTFQMFRVPSPVMSHVNERSFESIIATLRSKIFSPSHTYDFETYALWAVDLITEKKRLIPLAYIYDSATYLDEPRTQKNDYHPSTSGFAAHTSQEAAIENALLELIERDAFLRWWKNPENGKVVDVPDAQKRIDYLVQCARQHLNNPTIELKIIVLPSPFQLPSIMACLVSKDRTKIPALVVGAAAHFSFNVAVDNALNELTVGLLNLIARFHETKMEFGDLPSTYEHIKTPHDHFYLFHNPKLISKMPFHELILEQQTQEWIEPENSIRTLQALKEDLKNKNMNAFVIDITPEWLQRYKIHVVRCGIIELFPLHFGHPLLINMDDASNYSAKNNIPHCFP